MNRRRMLTLISLAFASLWIVFSASNAVAQAAADMDGVKAASKAFYVALAALDGGTAMQGAGSTHAWAEVYLPGAGWIEYDPTNGVVAGENLIRVAVTRDPSQAIPISGTFTGAGSDFLDITVEVTVTRQR